MTAADEALAAATAKPGQTWAGVVSEPTWISPRTVETGAYRLYVACAGPGSIGLEIRADGRSLSGENVSCGDNPIAEEIPLAVTERTSYVLVLNGTDEPAYAIKLIRNEGTLGDAPPPLRAVAGLGNAVDPQQIAHGAVAPGESGLAARA